MAKRRFFSCSRCEREIELDDGDGLQTKECSGCGTWFVIMVREGRVFVLEEHPPGSSASPY